MGGLLFATGPIPLTVPRLSTPLYNELKTKYIGLLQPYFATIICPAEAPGKLDHGDIDLMAAGPIPPTLDPASLAPHLNATRHVTNGPTTSFAVPHPDDEDTWVQLDLHICPDPERFEWEVFEHAYGGLWQMIGVCLRPLGFTATDKGFHTRIAPIERAGNRKESFVFLTHSPDEVMQFLGLDVERYRRGFDSEKELFEWVTDAGFFSRELVNAMKNNSNDRRRRGMRGMFRRFVDEWVAGCEAREVAGKEWKWEVASVRAVRRWGKKEMYDEKMREHQLKMKEKLWWEMVGTVVPVQQGEKRNLVVRALKRWVGFEDGRIVVNGSANMEDEDAGRRWLGATEELGQYVILSWVLENWEVVQRKEKRRIRSEKDERALAKEGSTVTGILMRK